VDTLHTAVRVFPAPLSATVPQLAMLVPPLVKLTLPPGALPVTDAVKVTFAPTMEGLIELTRPVLVVVLGLTTWESEELLDPVLAPSPEYAATMLCVPADSAAVLHAAVRVLPLPVSATVPQAASVVPPSVKPTVPVGALPVTEAVNVTFAPTIDGLAVLVTLVVAAALLLTTCVSAELLDAVFELSPAYEATMLCVPTARPAALHAPVRVLPVPDRATAPQPAMAVPPSVKLSVPVGAAPVTDALNVTVTPTIDGLIELATLVVVVVLLLTT
jgi:hypothetical protein